MAVAFMTVHRDAEGKAVGFWATVFCNGKKGREWRASPADAFHGACVKAGMTGAYRIPRSVNLETLYAGNAIHFEF